METGHLHVNKILCSLFFFPGPKPGEAEHQQSAVWKRKGWEQSLAVACSGCSLLGRKLPLSPSGTANGWEKNPQQSYQNTRWRHVEHQHCGSETSAGVHVAVAWGGFFSSFGDVNKDSQHCCTTTSSLKDWLGLGGQPLSSSPRGSVRPEEFWPLQLLTETNLLHRFNVRSLSLLRHFNHIFEECAKLSMVWVYGVCLMPPPLLLPHPQHSPRGHWWLFRVVLFHCAICWPWVTWQVQN